MSWGNLFRRANSYAQAKAQAELDTHADPRIQFQQAIAGLQEHHRDLEAAAGRVIAQERLAKSRLSSLSTQEASYVSSARAAQQQGNLDAARAFALKIAMLREQIQALSAQIPQLESDANDARTAVQESATNLQQKMSERSAVMAQIDQTAMQNELAKSMAAITDIAAATDVPSLDEIKDKVAAQYAEAQARTELSESSPEVQEMHVHHAELISQADAVLAALDQGTLKPAALESAADTSAGALEK